MNFEEETLRQQLTKEIGKLPEELRFVYTKIAELQDVLKEYALKEGISKARMVYIMQVLTDTLEKNLKRAGEDWHGDIPTEGD